ncbi:MAG: PQQ-binding-like beta-propeller repeat protein [Deltaproteobacteria bacterium]|nr:PQQ-binding-like beta-propeller repeat protein [Deltaproteobacteria bacterium]
MRTFLVWGAVCVGALDGCGTMGESTCAPSERWTLDAHRALADGTVLVQSSTLRDHVTHVRLSRFGGDGRTLWERELGPVSGYNSVLPVTDEVVVVATEVGSETVLAAHTLADGTPAWTQTLGPSQAKNGERRSLDFAAPTTESTPSRDVVLAFSDTLVCLDGKTGAIGYRGPGPDTTVLRMYVIGPRVFVTTYKSTLVLERCQVRASREFGRGFRVGNDFVHVPTVEHPKPVELEVFPSGDPARSYRVLADLPVCADVTSVGGFRGQFVLMGSSSMWFVERDGRLAGALQLGGIPNDIDGELPRFAPYKLGVHGGADTQALGKWVGIVVDHQQRRIVGSLEPEFSEPLLRGGSHWYLRGVSVRALGVLDGDTGKLTAARESYFRLEKQSQIAGDHVWFASADNAVRVDGRTLVPTVRSPFAKQIPDYPRDVLGTLFWESNETKQSERNYRGRCNGGADLHTEPLPPGQLAR